MKKLILLLFFVQVAFAQPTEKLVKIIVGTDHDDWLYKIGENATFNITVLRN